MNVYLSGFSFEFLWYICISLSDKFYCDVMVFIYFYGLIRGCWVFCFIINVSNIIKYIVEGD